MEKLDGYATDAAGLKVSGKEMEDADALVSPELKSAIVTAADNIIKFHAAQLPQDITMETSPGVICTQKNVPLDTVGLYIPGGTAPLFSTVLMLAGPAKIAGVSKIVICTPAGKDGKVSPSILFAAKVCGVDEIYKVGGAIAVAAMAYGTETIPKTDKIFGPGNAFVMEAKQQISHVCAIDMPAGPSEVLIMADDSARADFVSADFLSQLEHGKDSQAILLTTSEALAVAVAGELPVQEARLSRKSFVDRSIAKSVIVVLSSEDEMVEFSNFYAPEHLIIATSESAGDYASGTNHTLPTGGWAVSYSGVNLSSFMKKITVQEISEDGLRKLGPVIEAMAMAEGLDAHANAVRIRLNEKTRVR